jgi:predicted amidohydrolase
VAPWGEVLADGGEEPGWVAADLDMEKIEKARRAVPSLSNDRPYDLGRAAATQAAE